MALTVLLAGCATGPPETLSTHSQTKTKGTINKNTAEKPSIENLVTLYQDALTELNNNNFKIAEKHFLEVTRTHPDFAGPWANLAVIYIKQEHYKKAKENIRKALEKNPEMAQALNMAGFMEEKNGNINKAKSYYEKAITKKPGYALAHYNLALLYDVYLQNIAEAVKHYQKYLSLSDDEDEETENWVEELKLNINHGDT
ncbi:MAG: tetratricopeptide repeat protein [Gammaproteobacteria bacterium]|nr:tetratricopeptide repeat protein [Gammaproteobacteria bacterium]